MIPNEAMARPGAGKLIDRAAQILVSMESMQRRCAEMVGQEFPLVFWRGACRVVASDDTRLSLLVGGTRVDLSWERLTTTWVRLLSNHTLTVDELGGAADAVGIVSLFAYLEAGHVSALEADGLLVLEGVAGTPVHQYADMSRATS